MLETQLRIPPEIARRRTLTPSAKLIYGLLSALGARFVPVSPTVSEIATALGIGERTAYRAIRALRRRRLIRVHGKRVGPDPNRYALKG